MIPATSARLRELAGNRALWLLVLLAIALAYYGSYYRHGIGFRDEGGTVALGAQRLLNGERPFEDVSLGYNVLWFYPVVALYKLFGVSYVLLRVWCFALSTLTAVLGFLLVEKLSRRAWLAFLVGLLLILLPGSTFKNYIPLLAVANTLCLVNHVLADREPRQRWRATLIGGIVLGLTFLIRIDVGFLCAALWLGLPILRALLERENLGRRVAIALGEIALIAAAALALHLPVYADARHRGFDRALFKEYATTWRMISAPIAKVLPFRQPQGGSAWDRKAGAPETAKPSLNSKPSLGAPSPTNPAAPGAAAEKTALRRAGLKDIDATGQNTGRLFLFLMWAPVASLVVLVASAVFILVRGRTARDDENVRRGLLILMLAGGALTIYAPFFFFRPDLPHLSEFMPGFFVAAAGGLALLYARRSGRWLRCLFTFFLIMHTAVYAAHVGLDASTGRWVGTIGIRQKRTKLFNAENGVNVFVSARELLGLTAVQSLIRDHTTPKDYVVCYPYSPGINLLANRRTYEKNVYVDNAMHSTYWDEEAIGRIERFKPAVIVLSDWDINGSDGSRFSVWAVKAKTYIQTNYVNQGTYIVGSDAFEIFTRP